MLEQPYGLLLIVASMRDYAEAFALYEADPPKAPSAVRALVLTTAAASVRREN